MTTLQIAAWIGIAVPLFVSAAAFVGTRIFVPDTLSEYLVCSKKLKRHHFLTTLSASNAALANILFLYAYWGFTYGVWAWIWGGLFWGVGLLVFYILMRRSRLAQLTEGNRPELGLNEIIGRHYSSRLVLVSAAIVSALAFLFLLALELNVGSRLFNVAVPASTTTTPYAIALGFGLVLAFYAAFGGFPMVVRTDFIQLGLVILACFAVWYSASAHLPNDTSWTLIRDSARSDPFFVFGWSHIPFVVGSLFSWGLWFVCTMDMWQRSMAIESRAGIGLRGLLPGYVLLLFVTGTGVIAGLFVRKVTGTYFDKFPLITFVETIAADVAGSKAIAWSFGIMIAGFVAALLSTVDTYLIIVAHSLAGDAFSKSSRWLGDIAKHGGQEAIRTKHRIQVAVAAVPFVAVLLFWLTESVAEQDTFTLYMIAGSIPMALVPVSLAVVRNEPRVLSPGAASTRGLGIVTAMLAAVVIGTTVNFILARHALALSAAQEYSDAAVFYGLIYFVPMLVVAIAVLPFLRRRRG